MMPMALYLGVGLLVVIVMAVISIKGSTRRDWGDWKK